MSDFVSVPHLPHRAKQIILGEKYRAVLHEALVRQGLEPIYAPDHTASSEWLSGHCDLFLLHAGGNLLFASSELKGSTFAEILSEAGFSMIFIKDLPGKCYPKDALMNVCLLGKRLICAEKVSSEEIFSYFRNEGFEIINVKQGYVKCSVCMVNENSVITSDAGIAAALEKHGIEVLQIEPGHIELPGYPYGFLGGATFKISEKRLAFTGSLDGHPEKTAILDFLRLRGIEAVYLTDLPIFDIGSAIPITEY